MEVEKRNNDNEVCDVSKRKIECQTRMYGLIAKYDRL